MLKRIDMFQKKINCLKFCDTHELTLRGHDENSDSVKSGIFLGLYK